MISRPKTNKTLFLLAATGSLIAGLAGVLAPEMYAPVVTDRVRPGVYAQDVMVIPTSVAIILLAFGLKPGAYRKVIVITGLLGVLFYVYAIYAIEQVYTPFYLLYLAVLALSFYALAVLLTSLRPPAFEALEIRPGLRWGAAAYGVFIAAMFSIIWIGQLMPLVRAGRRIENTFSVYIIDLVFVMPAFVIASILMIRRRALGIVGLPALFIVGVGILSPLALAELLKPYLYGQPMNMAGLSLYGILSLSFLVVAIACVNGLEQPRLHALVPNEIRDDRHVSRCDEGLPHAAGARSPGAT